MCCKRRAQNGFIYAREQQKQLFGFGLFKESDPSCSRNRPPLHPFGMTGRTSLSLISPTNLMHTRINVLGRSCVGEKHELCLEIHRCPAGTTQTHIVMFALRRACACVCVCAHTQRRAGDSTKKSTGDLL